VKANQYRKQIQKAELTGDITLPSGAIFKMRRPPLHVWMAAGRMPQHFLRAMLEQQNASPGSAVAMTADETLEGLQFISDCIIHACVEPRVAITPEFEDVLALSEIDPDDFQFLTQWVQSNAPGVPVATRGGEVETARLDRFRQKRAGGGFVDDRPDSK
jgi:hypothetical protein